MASPLSPSLPTSPTLPVTLCTFMHNGIKYEVSATKTDGTALAAEEIDAQKILLRQAIKVNCLFPKLLAAITADSSGADLSELIITDRAIHFEKGGTPAIDMNKPLDATVAAEINNKLTPLRLEPVSTFKDIWNRIFDNVDDSRPPLSPSIQLHVARAHSPSEDASSPTPIAAPTPIRTSSPHTPPPSSSPLHATPPPIASTTSFQPSVTAHVAYNSPPTPSSPTPETDEDTHSPVPPPRSFAPYHLDRRRALTPIPVRTQISAPSPISIPVAAPQVDAYAFLEENPSQEEEISIRGFLNCEQTTDLETLFELLKIYYVEREVAEGRDTQLPLANYYQTQIRPLLRGGQGNPPSQAAWTTLIRKLERPSLPLSSEEQAMVRLYVVPTHRLNPLPTWVASAKRAAAIDVFKSH